MLAFSFLSRQALIIITHSLNGADFAHGSNGFAYRLTESDE